MNSNVHMHPRIRKQVQKSRNAMADARGFWEALSVVRFEKPLPLLLTLPFCSVLLSLCFSSHCKGKRKSSSQAGVVSVKAFETVEPLCDAPVFECKGVRKRHADHRLGRHSFPDHNNHMCL